MTAHIPTVGTISHGTLRPEDLLTRWTDALVAYGDGSPTQAFLIGRARGMIESLPEYRRKIAVQRLLIGADAEPPANEVAIDTLVQNMLDDLFDVLDEIAAKHGLTFSAHPGDGSDFGFWEPESDENQP